MLRLFARPLPLLALLALCTAIPVMVAALRMIQIPAGTLPQDALRFAAAPGWHFIHSLGGVAFGLLGPLQFLRALRRRFGRLHRLAGRAFVLAGAALAFGGIGLWLAVDSIATPLLDGARLIASAALLWALWRGIDNARRGWRTGHRDWMIRAYAIGMGSGTVGLVMGPLYLIAGEPLTGWLADAVFVGWWLFNVALAEWVIRRLPALHPAPHPSPARP